MKVILSLSPLFYRARRWLLLAIVMQHLDMLVFTHARDLPFQKFTVSERLPEFLSELGLNPVHPSSQGENEGLKGNVWKSLQALQWCLNFYSVLVPIDGIWLPFVP